MNAVAWKDYALKGGAEGATLLTAEGFEDKVEQAWFSAQVDRKAFKALIKRTDARAIRDFAIWIAALVASGIGAYLTWGSWWCVPFFAVYGVLYSAADHRHHELSHGTVFRTRWLNEVLFHVCAFMTLREGFYYRWSHTRHHTHTIIVGRDPEISAPRPPAVFRIASDFFFLNDGTNQIRRLLRNASGALADAGKHFVPESGRSKVVLASRIYLAVFAAVIAACLYWQTILPAMFIVLPRFYGGVLSHLFNMSQHAGLDEDVYDHRLNTRTVTMNPLFDWLYFNMNYHIEHHMFPMVPYHRLPDLHAMIRDQCPPAYPSLWAAHREIWPALMRQRKEPAWYVRRVLPVGAQPEVATPGA